MKTLGMASEAARLTTQNSYNEEQNILYSDRPSHGRSYEKPMVAKVRHQYGHKDGVVPFTMLLGQIKFPRL